MDTEHTPTLTEELQASLDQLESGRWGALSAFLLRVQRTGAWRDTSRNFSEWIRGLVKAHGVSLGQIWRYRASGLYYQRLKQTHPDLPELAELPRTISAEALEILEKIERVAPKELVEDTTDQVLSGEVPIRELKALWRTYKPALQGNTNRGRGESPRAAIDRFQLFESTALFALRKYPASWVGTQTPHRFHLFDHFQFQTEAIEYDAVALVQPDTNSPIELHVVEVGMGLDTREVRTFLNAPPDQPDFCWVLVQEPPADALLAQWSSFVGLLGYQEERPKVYQAAKRQQSTTTLSPFARELVLHALKV